MIDKLSKWVVVLSKVRRFHKSEVLMSIKDIRRNYIIDIAIKLFFKESMADIKIKDIANKAGIGEATFYRYFPNRTSLIAACATFFQDEVGRKYFLFENKGNGFDKLKLFYYRFYEIFKAHQEYYKFLSEFDAYCTRIDRKWLTQYSEQMEFFRDSYISIYNEGVADGSVREVEDINGFYFATTHALLSLCKKFAFEGNIIKQDELINKEAEVKTIADICLYALKK